MAFGGSADCRANFACLGQLNTSSRYLPLLVVLVSAAVWGLFWIPLRAFQTEGLEAASATTAQFVVPLVLLVPFAIRRWTQNRATGVAQISTGLLVGAAFVLYYQSLLLTEVVRALLLFYITPVWGTLLEALVLRRKVSPFRIVALVLGVAGLYAILSSKGGLPLPQNAGDYMALLSGLVFAIGALRIRSMPEMDVFENVFSLFLYGTLFAVATSFLPIEALGTVPSWSVVLPLLPWLLAMAVFFLIPVMWGLLWGAKHVDPGRLGILFQMEAVVGIASAAVLANEPFGWPEAAATGLIISASVLDVFGGNNTDPPKVS